MATFSLKRFIIASLRRASYRMPSRQEAIKAARIDRNTYVCAFCEELFPRKFIQIDHISPIVPITGWDSWDGFINRLFCEASEMQLLCKPCHRVKTKQENTERRAA